LPREPGLYAVIAHRNRGYWPEYQCAATVRPCSPGLLLLPLSGEESAQELPEAPALRITVSRFTIGGRVLRFLDLVCPVPELESVFMEVSDEILARIESGVDCIVAARSTIEDFRALLLRRSGSEVSTARIAGLVGELLILNRLLDRSPKAWRIWRGPTGDRHDFRSGDRSLEVKCTTRAADTTVSVSSLEQMETPTGGSLYLLHLTLERVANGRLAVPTLVQAALAKADNPDRVRELLSAVGYTDSKADQWSGAMFRLEDEQLYEVGEGFPRLVPSMLVTGGLPAGLSSITYDIDLAAAAAFGRDAKTTASLEKELVACLQYD
jgi:hypothetical protein